MPKTKRTAAPEPTWHEEQAQETERVLRDAMQRLLGGKPKRGSGKLTVTNLAAEAGVSRATANRYPAVLRDFAQHLGALREDPEAENLHERVRRAEAALREKTRQSAARERELTSRLDTYAQQIQYLTVRLRDMERAAAERTVAGDISGGVRGRGRR